MTKEDIIKVVQECSTDESLKAIVVGWINLTHRAAYDEGYMAGMKRGVEVQGLIEEQLTATLNKETVIM